MVDYNKLMHWLEEEKQELERNLAAARDLGDKDGVARVEGAIDEIQEVQNRVKQGFDSSLNSGGQSGY